MGARQPQGTEWQLQALRGAERQRLLLIAPHTPTGGRTIEGLFPQIPEARQGRLVKLRTGWGEWWKPQPLPPQISTWEGGRLQTPGRGEALQNQGVSVGVVQAQTGTFPIFKNPTLLFSQQTLPMPFLATPGPVPGNSSGLQAEVPEYTCSTLNDYVLTANCLSPPHPKTRAGPCLFYPLLGTQ